MRIHNDFTVQCVLHESMPPNDLEQLPEALDSLLERLSMENTSKLGRQDVDDLLPFARKQCQEEWVRRIPQSVL